MTNIIILGCIGPLVLICLFWLTFLGIIILIELRYILVGRK